MVNSLSVGGTAVEPVAELADELALWPSETLVVSVDHEHALRLPALALDLLWRSAVSAEPPRCPSHRVTSCKTAAYPATSRSESSWLGSCLKRSSLRSIMQSATCAAVTGWPRVSDHRWAIASMLWRASPYALPRSATTPKDSLVYLLSEFSRPYASRSFGNRIRKWCDEIVAEDGTRSMDGLSSHGMRKASAQWWVDNYQADNFKLKAIFGWLTDKEANHYTQGFDRQRAAASTVVKFPSKEATG